MELLCDHKGFGGNRANVNLKCHCCIFTRWNHCVPQMDRWRSCQSSRPNLLRSCLSMLGMATWGCRGFSYHRTPPSPAGCSLLPRATPSTVESTTSPCKRNHTFLHHTSIQLIVFKVYFCGDGQIRLSFSLFTTLCDFFCSFLHFPVSLTSHLSFADMFDGVPLQL